MINENLFPLFYVGKFVIFQFEKLWDKLFSLSFEVNDKIAFVGVVGGSVKSTLCS
jgi:hypothetical protein